MCCILRRRALFSIVSAAGGRRRYSAFSGVFIEAVVAGPVVL